MRAGPLRHKIKIQEKTQTSDGMGGFTSAWADSFETRAAVMPLSSKEQLDAMKLESMITNKIRIRYRAGITSANRILFGSRVFNIKGAPINYDERNKTLDLLVTEDS